MQDFINQLLEFIINHIILCGIFFTLLMYFIYTELKKGGSSVSTQELVRLLNKENAIVVDIRSNNEFRKGHILNSINIPSADLSERMSEISRHKQSCVVIVDSMGQTAGSSGKKLKAAAFVSVQRLKGGVHAWQSANLPLVKV